MIGDRADSPVGQDGDTWVGDLVGTHILSVNPHGIRINRL